MLIGVSGKQQVGKTTLANIAVQEFGFVRRSFAFALREELIDILETAEIDYSLHGLYTHKELALVLPYNLPEEFRAESFTELCEFNPIYHVRTITYRKLLQWYGAFKREQNPDYWVQKLIDSINPTERTIIDDVRMINEAVYIQVLGGTLIRVNWKCSNSGSQHISETQLDNFPGFTAIINKSPTMALAEYRQLCYKHLELWIGALDDHDTRGNCKITP